MKKILTIFTGFILMLTGCASNSDADGDTDKSEDVGVDRSEELIIYTNSGSGEWLTERAEEEGFKINVVQGAGGDLTDRLIAEQNNPIADLIYGLDTMEYEKLKKEDLLVEFTPEWASEVDKDLGDRQYYYPIAITPLVFIYNEDKLGGRPVPTDMLDFIEPEFEDAYALRGNHGGTGKTVLASLIARYADEDGELGVSDEGWEITKQFVQNGHYEVLGEDLIGDIISGDRPIGSIWGSGVLQNQKERDFEFDVMQPDIGVPFVVEGTAIIDEDKKDLGIEFIDWFGSAEIQEEWSNEFDIMPAHQRALEQAPDEVKEFMEKVESQDMDWELITEYIDSWVEKVELEFIE